MIGMLGYYCPRLIGREWITTSSSQTLTLASHLSSSQHHIATACVKATDFANLAPVFQAILVAYSFRSFPNSPFRRRERLLFRSCSFYGDRCESPWLASLRKEYNLLAQVWKMALLPPSHTWTQLLWQGGVWTAAYLIVVIVTMFPFFHRALVMVIGWGVHCG